jgi:hypothetical protein
VRRVFYVRKAKTLPLINTDDTDQEKADEIDFSLNQIFLPKMYGENSLMRCFWCDSFSGSFDFAVAYAPTSLRMTGVGGIVNQEEA